MGKHGNEDNQKVGGDSTNTYEPKHDGGRDANDWAKVGGRTEKPKGK